MNETDFESEFWNENVSNFRFVAFDTETTGSSTTVDHLVEIGASSFDEEFEHRRFELFVKPPRVMPPEIIKIHGISDEMVAEALAAGPALEKFYEFLSLSGSPRVLVAHNAGFDVGMIHSEFKRDKSISTGVPEIVLDSCMLAKRLLPELAQHRLEGLAAHFKIPTGRMHRAMEDVRALQAVFLKLLGLAADHCAQAGQGLTLNMLVDLAGGYFILNARAADARARPFRLPPRISAIEPLCGTDARVAIMYEVEQDYRYITPIAIKMRGFKVYVEAFCHRENIKKTFRADKILKIGRVEQPC